jgi:ribosome maturation factor RimP
MKIKEERTGIDLKFYQLSKKVVEGENLKLYDMEYFPGTGELKVYILDEKTKTAILDDCVRVDRAFDDYLEEDWVPHTITLEVSSPGLYRKLKTREHFLMVEGSSIKLRLAKNLGALIQKVPRKLQREKWIVCMLESVREDRLVLRYEDLSFELSFEDIVKANLETKIGNLRG